jgi:hypothetical protein
LIITLVFEKKIFAANCQKSQKIVIIKSTPGLVNNLQGFCGLGTNPRFKTTKAACRAIEPSPLSCMVAGFFLVQYTKAAKINTK